MRWVDYGTEQNLLDLDNRLVGRIVKNGCCWRASFGVSAFSAGRYRNLEDAKRAVEQLARVKRGG